MSKAIISENEIDILTVVSFRFNGTTVVAMESCDYWFSEELNKEDIKNIIEKLTEWHDKM